MAKQKRSRLQKETSENEIRVLASEYNRLCVKGKKLRVKHAFIHAIASPTEMKFSGWWHADVLDERIAQQKEIINMALKLAEPHPSNPMKPSKHCLYFYQGKPPKSTNDDDKNFRDLGTYPWATTYAAKRFLDEVIADEETEILTMLWAGQKEKIIYIPAIRVWVRAPDGLDKILDYKLSADERKWEIPQPYDGHAYFLRTGERMPRRTPPPGAPEKSAEAPKREKRERTTQTPRAAPPGTTTIATLCEELELEPRVARGVLRKNGIEKPYAWKDAELDRIRTLLKKGAPR